LQQNGTDKFLASENSIRPSHPLVATGCKGGDTSEAPYFLIDFSDTEGNDTLHGNAKHSH
jgi:hypothetical protein